MAGRERPESSTSSGTPSDLHGNSSNPGDGRSLAPMMLNAPPTTSAARSGVNLAEPLQTPRNMPELLQASTAVSSGQDSQIPPLDEERLEFLRGALEAFAPPDVIGVLKQAMGVIEGGSGEDATKVEAYEEIMNVIDQVDFARDFLKIGGLNTIRSSLYSTSLELQGAACSAIGRLSDNNEPVQEQFLLPKNEDILNRLFELMESSDVVLKGKALHALSAIVRNIEGGPDVLTRNTFAGFSAVLRCLDSRVPRLEAKSAFLLDAMVFRSSKETILQLIQMGFVEELAFVLTSHEVEGQKEVFLSALLSFLTHGDEEVKSCGVNALLSCAQSLALKPKLEERIEILSRCETVEGDVDSGWTEEIRHIESVLSLLDSQPIKDDEQDR